MDKNIVVLEGRIGTDFKYGKTNDGKEYATFSLVINAYDKEISDSTERTHSETYIRTMCFDKRQVEYLRGVKARSGQRVHIFGRLNSHRSDYRGIDLIQNTVVVRDVSIIKSSK